MSDSDVPGRPRPTGPVYCPSCRRAVAEAADGEHACGCGAREDGCGPGARLRARLGDVLRDVDDLTAERDTAVAEAARLRVLLDAALMALADEQTEAQREVVSLCKAANIQRGMLGREIAKACSAAHRWRMRAARKTAELHKVRREMGADRDALAGKLLSARLLAARWKRLAKALRRDRDLLRTIAAKASK